MFILYVVLPQFSLLGSKSRRGPITTHRLLMYRTMKGYYFRLEGCRVSKTIFTCVVWGVFLRVHGTVFPTVVVEIGCGSQTFDVSIYTWPQVVREDDLWLVRDGLLISFTPLLIRIVFQGITGKWWINKLNGSYTALNFILDPNQGLFSIVTREKGWVCFH